MRERKKEREREKERKRERGGGEGNAIYSINFNLTSYMVVVSLGLSNRTTKTTPKLAECVLILAGSMPFLLENVVTSQKLQALINNLSKIKFVFILS